MREVKVSFLFLLIVSSLVHAQRPTKITVFEGARLILGDGKAPIENSAFIVENDHFTSVGRKGELQAPPGALKKRDLRGPLRMDKRRNDQQEQERDLYLAHRSSRR